MMKDVKYFHGKDFKAKWLADDIIRKYHIKTMDDSEEVYIYNKGVYIPSETIIKQEVQKALHEDASKNRASEVEGHVKRSTYISRELFNKPLNLINLKNGILDLNKNKIMKHSPEFLFTIQLPIYFKPNAECPNFKKFIHQTLTKETHKLIQELFGYLLWKNYEYQYAIIFFGEGSNGKTTLLNVIIKFVGSENISHISLHEMGSSRFSSAELYGKLANIYADLSDKELDDTSLFKQITGGDKVKGEKKFKNPFYFSNYAKLFFSANRIPATSDDTHAFYRRWILVKFPFTFTEEKGNPNLINELTTNEELSGILNWAVEGLQRLHKNKKFSNHLTLKEIKDLYIKESNPILLFVQSLLSADMNSWTSKRELYEAYVFFCKENNYPVVEDNVFGRKVKPYILALSPFISGSRHGYIDGWKGLKIGL
ncbi:hypothetical protein HN789_06115 [archaeon]|jgi:putative DNA primase/helicase|nr:hypothetical protein [archaeon]MBT7440793.1 hypothetical protein [archaeon]